jgi:hypothetical protein
MLDADYFMALSITKERNPCTITEASVKPYCYMCEVSLVVALALLQQCNSTTLAFP